jgi:iron complex outermembrane recepter protein
MALSSRFLCALAAVAALALLPTTALAADGGHLLQTASPADTPVVVNPFTVTVDAARQAVLLKDNPAATTVLGPREIARMPRGIAAEEVLARIPGVRVDNQADGERVHISIRGQGVLTEGGVRGIKVLLDGLPLNDPTGVAPDLYDVDWSTVDHVEVLRGPAAALYGGGGSGGVINIVTRAAGGEGRALASGEGGSNGFRKSLGEASGAMGPVDYRFSASSARSDGWRQHTEFWGDNFYGKFHWANERIDVRPIVAYTQHFEQNAEGLNRAQFYADPRQPNPDAVPKNEYYEVTRLTGGLVSRLAIAPGQALNLTGFVRSMEYGEPRPGEIIGRTLQSPGATVQYDLDVVTGSLQHHVSAGSDLLWQTVNENRRENLGNAVRGELLSKQKVTQGSQGVFLMDRVGFAKDWTLVLSGRWDAISNEVTDLLHPANSMSKDFDHATGRAGLAWAALEPLNLYANWSMGFLPPATAELLNNPDAMSGFNQELTFSTSNGEEIGARGVLPHGLNYELTGFALQTQDDIGRFRLLDRWGIDFYRNVGDTKRLGVETRLGWQPCSCFSLDAAYTWSRFKYSSPEAIDGKWLPNSPEHMLSLSADGRFGHGLSAGIETGMQSKWAVSTSNAAWATGFALWGAHAAYSWTGSVGGEVSLIARNIFDAKYMAFTEPDFDNTDDVLVDVWNSYQPGSPAQVYLRVTLTH